LITDPRYGAVQPHIVGVAIPCCGRGQPSFPSQGCRRIRERGLVDEAHGHRWRAHLSSRMRLSANNAERAAGLMLHDGFRIASAPVASIVSTSSSPGRTAVDSAASQPAGARVVVRALRRVGVESPTLTQDGHEALQARGSPNGKHLCTAPQGAWCSTRPNPRLNGEGTRPIRRALSGDDLSGESEKGCGGATIETPR